MLLATRSAAVALCFFGRVRLWLSVMSLARRVGFVMLNTATMPCFTVLADLVHNDFHGLPLDPVPLSVADGEASDRLAVDKKSPSASYLFGQKVPLQRRFVCVFCAMVLLSG